jgi:protein-S-isoprenylcysteine O-methyltransferase Ste14
MNILHKKALCANLIFLVATAALLFISAGTLNYWHAWIFLAVYFVASAAITFYFLKMDPALVERRMSAGPTAETEKSQKIIMFLMVAGFAGVMVVPALDHRFGWSHMPPSMALAGDALVALGQLAIFIVFKENTFAAATIKLSPGQKVISTGLYARVRHPMYAGGLVMLVGVPIALGSWWGLLVVAAMTPALIWRLIDEEKFL